MKSALPYIGWFVGMAIGGCTGVSALVLIFAIVGAVIGHSMKKNMEEEEENQRRAQEEYERRRRQEEWDRKRKAERKAKAISLARKYPEATKYYFKYHWGLIKSTIYDYDITEDKVDTLLSHEWSYERDEQTHSPAYKARIEAEREAARKKEEAKREAARQAELAKRRAEEEERRNLPITLPACVSSWYTHSRNGSLKHKWFVDYYPYNKYKDSASLSIRDAWTLVWNFKNDDRISTYEHKSALDKVIKITENTLKSCFGTKTKYLTFVCLTASTKENTKRRFEEFSQRVCSDLGMKNGYEHIQIVADATPKHLGGNGVPSKHYDDYFFRNSYVILFDDVRTSGSSLIVEKNKLESMGAKVIGAITIAQTQS